MALLSQTAQPEMQRIETNEFKSQLAPHIGMEPDSLLSLFCRENNLTW